ncbi:MAG: tripartite tricarboxylate transporter TctB family protein [Alphaproteobacteria bacterium]|nr:tripartite tricarboxylate transporter TctB family protein [Alphaproteobacteria bacterium]
MPFRQLDRAVALAVFAFAAAYFLLAFQIRVPPSSDDSPLSARSFPFALGAVAMVLSALVALKPSHGDAIAFERRAWLRSLGLLALMGFYALAVTRLGFVITTAAFLAAGFRLLGERRPMVLALVAVGTAVGFWFLFRQLDVELDWGWFEDLLR